MSIIKIVQEIYELMFKNKPSPYPIRKSNKFYFSQIKDKHYETDVEHDAILLIGKRGVHDHGGKIPAERFNFLRKQRVKVIFASRALSWWIKYPGCNSCSLKTNAKEGKDFDFV